MPVGVRVGHRELAIEYTYTNVEQLLQRLYELSQAAAGGFEAFAAGSGCRSNRGSVHIDPSFPGPLRHLRPGQFR